MPSRIGGILRFEEVDRVLVNFIALFLDDRVPLIYLFVYYRFPYVITLTNYSTLQFIILVT